MQSFLAIETTRYHNWSGTKIASFGPQQLISMFLCLNKKVESLFRPRFVGRVREWSS